MPRHLSFLHALLPRLHETHPSYKALKKEIAKNQKGFNGEKKLDYHLTILPNDVFSILNDITFQQKGTLFQMDSFIISNHAIYIIESKSIEGEAIFNTNLEQFIQRKHQQEVSFKYPITQLEYIKFQLMKWLESRDLQGFPIFYFVSLAESSTILKVVGDEEGIREMVTFAENIPFFIMRKNETLSKMYQENRLLKNRIITSMMNGYDHLHIDYFSKYNIARSEILPGVVCRKCRLLGITYRNGVWTCPHCHQVDPTAFNKGLKDFFLLFGDSISNREARWFFGIPNRHTMTRIFQRSHLDYNKSDKRWYPRKHSGQK